MELLEKILLVVFVIVSIILVLCVLAQDDGQNGMGGLMGGRGTAAFGSHSASVLTNATVVLVVLFFLIAIGLAWFNRKGNAPTVNEMKDAQSQTQELQGEAPSAAEPASPEASPSEKNNW